MSVASLGAEASAEYGDNEAAVIDAFAVPSYLRLFWEQTRQLVLVGEASRLVHLGCRTGYPHEDILEFMPNTEVVGVDASESCLALARARSAEKKATYLDGNPQRTELQAQTFSHALLLHPNGNRHDRVALFLEASRLLYPAGQALVALPLSQSYQEILDLLAEYALKTDDGELSRALEGAATDRVTVESISEELETAGFTDVDFELGSETLYFDSGRSLLEDPSARFFIFPQIASWLEYENLQPAFEYVAKAVDKYWSDERLDLGVRMAAFSARR